MTSFYPGVTPKDLVPGDPNELFWLAGRLGTLANGLGAASGELARINAGSWSGDAARAFAARVHQQPQKYADASSAFGLAASAIRSYADALESAQRAAASAISEHDQANRASESWSYRKQRAEDAYAADPTKPKADVGSDPGDAGRSRAQAALASAHGELDAAAARTKAMLEEAKAGAPHRPSLLHRFLSGVEKVAKAAVKIDIKAIKMIAAFELALGKAEFNFGKMLVRLHNGDPDTWRQFLGGVWDGTKGIGQGVLLIAKISWAVLPPRALVDPKGWVKTQIDIVKGVGHGVDFAVEHPVQFVGIVGRIGESMVDWEDFQKNPARWLGELVPSLVIAVGTEGVGALAGRATATADRFSVASARAWSEEGDLGEMLANAQRAQRADQVARGITGLKYSIKGFTDLDEAGGVVHNVAAEGQPKQDDVLGDHASGVAGEHIGKALFGR